MIYYDYTMASRLIAMANSTKALVLAATVAVLRDQASIQERMYDSGSPRLHCSGSMAVMVDVAAMTDLVVSQVYLTDVMITVCVVLVGMAHLGGEGLRHHGRSGKYGGGEYKSRDRVI